MSMRALHSGNPQRAGCLTRSRLHVASALAAVAALVVNQITKPLAHAYVEQNGPWEITPFLTVTSGWNTGIAFGMGAFAHPSVLIVLGLGLSTVLAVFVVRAELVFERIALGLAIGGALSNVIDRARFGAVRDFIDLYWKGWHWPAFNFADGFIVLGLLSLLLPGIARLRPARPG